MMRRLLMCFLATVLAVSPAIVGRGEDERGKNDTSIEKLLMDYLQNRLEQARLSVKRVRQSEAMTMPALLEAEDEVGRWELHLLLAAEGRMTTVHPVLGELRRELGVPEITEIPAGKSPVVSAAMLEYLRGKLGRAERALKRTTALQSFGRSTEEELLAAKSKVNGLKLLLEVWRHNTPSEK